MRSCGIIYARTVDASHRFDVPEDFMKLDPTCHHDDEKLFELAEKFTTMQNSNLSEKDVPTWAELKEMILETSRQMRENERQRKEEQERKEKKWEEEQKRKEEEQKQKEEEWRKEKIGLPWPP